METGSIEDISMRLPNERRAPHLCTFLQHLQLPGSVSQSPEKYERAPPILYRQRPPLRSLRDRALELLLCSIHRYPLVSPAHYDGLERAICAARSSLYFEKMGQPTVWCAKDEGVCRTLPVNTTVRTEIWYRCAIQWTILGTENKKLICLWRF